jgi:hypothetical protein
MKRTRKKNTSLEGLKEFLDVLPASKAFDERCLRAFRIGVEVRGLRETRGSEEKFGPPGFVEYVKKLAKATRLTSRSVSDLLQWFGATGDDLLANGQRVGRLAQGIGMSLRELAVRIRVEIAESTGEPVMVLALGNGGRAEVTLDAYEKALSQIRWNARTEKALRVFEREASIVYETRSC